MFEKLKFFVQAFKRELKVYQLVLRDKRTPKLAKWLLRLAIAYALSPIDLIPDFIPVVGHLDDVVIVPILFWFAIRLIPKEVLSECRKRVEELQWITKGET